MKTLDGGKLDTHSAAWTFFAEAQSYYERTHDKTLHDAILEAIDDYPIPYHQNTTVSQGTPIYSPDLFKIIPPAITERIKTVLSDARIIGTDQRWIERVLHAYGFYQHYNEQITNPRNLFVNAYEHEAKTIAKMLNEQMTSELSLPIIHTPYMTNQQHLQMFIEQQRTAFIDRTKQLFDRYTAAVEDQLNTLAQVWALDNESAKKFNHYHAFITWQFTDRAKSEVAAEFGLDPHTFNKDVVTPIVKKLAIIPRS